MTDDRTMEEFLRDNKETHAARLAADREADFANLRGAFDDKGLTAEEKMRLELEADREAAIGLEPIDIFGTSLRPPVDRGLVPAESEPVVETTPEPVVEYHDTQTYDPIRLIHPLTVDGLRVEEITFRPPVFSDVEAVMSGEINELELHARMANLPVAVLRSLRWTDSEIVTFMARRLAPELRRG